MKYTKKPVTIEAFQMTRERRNDNAEWPEWLNAAWNAQIHQVGAVYPSDFPNSKGDDKVKINTLEGAMLVDWNDWIIKGVKGELYPCKPDIFELTYLKAGEEAGTPITGQIGVIVTDEMVWIAQQIFENEDTVYKNADDRYRAMIEAAMLAANVTWGPGELRNPDGSKAEFFHDFHTGQPSSRPQGDEELQNFVIFVADFLRQSLLQSKAPGPQICADIVDRATRLTEARKSMYIPYSNMVNNLFKNMDTPAASLMHAAIGVGGEGGELLDWVKKHWVYNIPMDKVVKSENGQTLTECILEELGDTLFYMTKIMNMFGWTMSDLQMANRIKLAKRYPDGVYSDKHAQARLDKVEEVQPGSKTLNLRGIA